MTAMPDRETSGPADEPGTAQGGVASDRTGTSGSRGSAPFLTPTTKPGPSRNVASWTTTSDWPRDTSVASVVPPGAVAQGHHRQHADDADRDERALDDARGHEADREPFVVAPEQRERDDRGADVGDDQQELQRRPDVDTRAAPAGADDEVLVVEQRSYSSTAGMLVAKVTIHSTPVTRASLRSDISVGRPGAEDRSAEDTDMPTPLGRGCGPSQARRGTSTPESENRWTASPGCWSEAPADHSVACGARGISPAGRHSGRSRPKRFHRIR